ncbi:MAG: undecaprenyl-diphosphate phosphatase [Lentisphaeria bacterium]|nr:undecaprenyl-diphosphate phosphatase [Lentisphaeria bacterium]
MEFLKTIILAAAQGVAEFLPVSSSGHLLVLGQWFGFDAEKNLTLNVVLHAGTLLAILVYYFNKILSILIYPRRRRLIGLVIAGSVPAAVVGFSLKLGDLDEKIFSSPWVAGVGFLFTGIMLITVFGKPWKKPDDEKSDAVVLEKMSFKQAVLIGCAQAFAILPGVSRSGSTISCGVLTKLRKADAAEFSFLLAIPAIGGAALLEFLEAVKNSGAICRGEISAMSIGFMVAAVTGYVSLAGLIKVLQKGRLGWFSLYLFAAAAITLAVECVKYF